MNYHFVVPLLICAAYALIAGGAPERIGAAAYLLSVVATHLLLASSATEWATVEYGVLAVDVLVFVAFTALATRADRFWPIWVSGLLGLGVLGHLARMAGPDVIPWAYAVVLTIWSYPILAILVVGTYGHQRRLRTFGSDPDWTAPAPQAAPARSRG